MNGGQIAGTTTPTAGGVWSDDLRESRAAIGRRLDIYGSFQAVMGQFTGGVFLTGYALALHADAPLIGLLACMRLAGRSSGWLRRFWQDYALVLAGSLAIAIFAHNEDHHPDLEVSYNVCTLKYSTHSVGGLSENDFICAAKIEAMRNL